MKRAFIVGFSLLWCIASASAADRTGSFSADSTLLIATNPLSMARVEEAVSIPIATIAKRYPGFDFASCIVTTGGVEIPSQIDDTNRDGRPDLLTFVTDFAPSERKTVVVKWGDATAARHTYTKRTQADLSIKVDYQYVDGKYAHGRYVRIDSVRVPAQHVDHDALFQHEGPAWESDKIGYRYYLDARNRTDIYGKKVPEMVLHTAGVHDLVADNNESYESMLPWGMDNFKVGASLGIGSVAMEVGGNVVTVSDVDSEFCVIAANGPVRSEVKGTYYGWKAGGSRYDLISSYSITAGSRLTMCVESITPTPPDLCTGIARHENTTLIESSNEPQGGWKYVGLYGAQSRAGDNMGIAVLYQGSDKIRRRDDSLSYLVVLRPHDGMLRYYFAAAWQQEPHGIGSLEEFRSYLEEVTRRLDAPIRISVERGSTNAN